MRSAIATPIVPKARAEAEVSTMIQITAGTPSSMLAPKIRPRAMK